MKRLIRYVSVVLAIILMTVSMAAVASAARTTTINLGDVRKNESGEGYEWNNPDRILTLDGLNITTEDDFGLKLPDNCTVVLKGTNRIKASKYGVGIPGSVVFEGNGKLIVEAGESALYNYSYSTNHKMRFSGGSFTLKGDKAILSSNAEISVTGGSLDLTATGESSVECRVFSLSGGSVDAVGAIHTAHLLEIDRGELSVTAKGSALVSDNKLKLENVKIKTGNADSALSSADEYNGEACVFTDPIPKGARDSILFGEGTPITVDYLFLAGAVILVAACVAVPYMRRKKKLQALYERLEAEKTLEKESKKKKKASTGK